MEQLEQSPLPRYLWPCSLPYSDAQQNMQQRQHLYTVIRGDQDSYLYGHFLYSSWRVYSLEHVDHNNSLHGDMWT